MKINFIKKPYFWLLPLAILLGFGFLIIGNMPDYQSKIAYKKLLINWQSIKIEEALLQTDLSDTLRKGLQTAERIRRFAADSLGLDINTAYTHLYDKPELEQVFLLTASPAYQLKTLKYKQSISDSIDYIVFFDKHSADTQHNLFLQQGYDIRIEQKAVCQLKKPLLTASVLDRSEAGLANIIFYELLKNKLKKSKYSGPIESMATFLSEKATLKYMLSRYGPHSNLYINFRNNAQDYTLYGRHIVRGAEQLDSLYHTFSVNMPNNQKDTLKQKCLIRIISRLDTIKFHLPEIYLNHFSEIGLPNNTYFLSYKSYRQDHELFEKQFVQNHHQDLIAYMKMLKAKK